MDKEHRIMQNTSFDAGMTDPEGFKEYICSTFRKALDEGWIQAYYQPVIRTVTGMLCGAEALCRWLDPKYGFISPAQFIPVLEERGLICQLDLHMMEPGLPRLCRALKDRSGCCPGLHQSFTEGF